ncbi:MAG: Maf family protein [Vallitaleaceae bacterium]|jgi:septum formation protein|nr:Maf family protein [Vallitaleaceae bacterium]
MKEILLASASPRRKEILELLEIPFTQATSFVDESLISHKNPIKLVSALALLKAKAIVKQANNNQIVLGADTVVVYRKTILGKPNNPEDVYAYLRKLSNKCHKVITAIALHDIEENTYFVKHCITKVRFGPITDEDIKGYIKTQEPYDKAGAYAIQGIGSTFVKWIKGDYYNVVGLPISTLLDGLSQLGYHYFKDLKR